MKKVFPIFAPLLVVLVAGCMGSSQSSTTPATGDKYDKVLTPGKTVKFIYAMADSDDFTAKHNIAKGYGELTLEG